jgi:hypothetical protein
MVRTSNAVYLKTIPHTGLKMALISNNEFPRKTFVAVESSWDVYVSSYGLFTTGDTTGFLRKPRYGMLPALKWGHNMAKVETTAQLVNDSFFLLIGRSQIHQLFAGTAIIDRSRRTLPWGGYLLEPDDVFDCTGVRRVSCNPCNDVERLWAHWEWRKCRFHILYQSAVC